MINPDTMVTLFDVTRVEVIDEDGRSYIKYLDNNQKVRYSIQDNSRTLKVFIQRITDES
jgi:hypothetical protein|tara:strand:- start:1470 stop:1646 length:177 start_codon:yes stop_codon:yes gene_type:complete